ncbi:unnamed protein product [Malus baccata var. baccata]
MKMICEDAVISWYSCSVFGFALKEFLGFLGSLFVFKKRWFSDGHGPIISLPFKHSDEFIGRFDLFLDMSNKFTLVYRVRYTLGNGWTSEGKRGGNSLILFSVSEAVVYIQTVDGTIRAELDPLDYKRAP